MKLKFLSLDAGPQGVRHPGSVHDIADDAEARALIDGGYAEPFAGGPVGPAPRAPKAAADGVTTETATAGPQAKGKPSGGKKGASKKGA
jgi:hypothetical protein